MAELSHNNATATPHDHGTLAGAGANKCQMLMYRQRKLGESDHILISNNSSCMYMSQIIELDRKYKPKKAIRTIDFIPIRKKITFQKKMPLSEYSFCH